MSGESDRRAQTRERLRFAVTLPVFTWIGRTLAELGSHGLAFDEWQFTVIGTSIHVVLFALLGWWIGGKIKT